jgi:hypothetical protein
MRVEGAFYIAMKQKRDGMAQPAAGAPFKPQQF